MVWKRGLSNTRIEDRIKTLDQRMLMGEQVLRKALIQVRDLCLQISTISVLDTVQTEPRTLEIFLNLQKEHIEISVSDQLGKFQKDSLEAVDKACAIMLDMSAESVRKNMSGTRSKSSSFTYTEQAARRNASRRLKRFLMLSDYIVVGTLHDLTLTYTTDFMNQIMTMPEPLFILSTQLSDGKIQMSPPASQFIACISEIHEQYLRQISKFKLTDGNCLSIANDAPKRDSDSEAGGINMVDLLRADLQLQKIMSATKSKLNSTVVAVESLITGMNVFETIYSANAALDIKWLYAPIEELNVDEAVKFFDDKLQVCGRQTEQINEILDTADVKNIRVDNRDLKKHLAPSPCMCFEKVCVALPQVARVLDSELLDRINSAANMLRSDPTNVEEMVAMLQVLDTCKWIP